MKNNFLKILASERFLLICCGFIFLFSILLRSMMDIGADTSAYIDSARKITEGKGYYYGFFDGNFPLSFYFYALQYKLSSLLHVNPMIFSEIVINLLGLLSIFYSAKILQQSSIYQNKGHYNLIIISYFLGFFLRYSIIEIGEFGTKSSLLLILLYPYIAYCFPRKTEFSLKDLIGRGCLMGLIPCLKPHYLFFVLLSEGYLLFQDRKFFRLDRLITVFIGVFYLFLIIEFIPEFFDLMLPMQAVAYQGYSDGGTFFWNTRYQIGYMLPFFLIFLIFLRLKFDESDLILTLFFISGAIVILLENIGSSDQYVTFSAIATTCYAKFAYDLFCDKNFAGNKFLIALAILLPIFNFSAIYGNGIGFHRYINFCWLLIFSYVIFLIFQKNKIRKMNLIFFFIFCLLVLIVVALATWQFQSWRYIIHSFAILAILFFLEKRICFDFRKTFSSPLLFLLISLIFSHLYFYVKAAIPVLTHQNPHTLPNRLSDSIAYYGKVYAKKNDDGIVMVSNNLYHIFPTLHYLKKTNSQKMYAGMLQAGKYLKGGLMFPVENSNEAFAYYYMFDDIKLAIKNPATKVVFINNTPLSLMDYKLCKIGNLEFYFLDPEFRKFFLKNFHFENRITSIAIDNNRVTKKSLIKNDGFDSMAESRSIIFTDFEVYVRN